MGIEVVGIEVVSGVVTSDGAVGDNVSRLFITGGFVPVEGIMVGDGVGSVVFSVCPQTFGLQHRPQVEGYRSEIIIQASISE